MAALGVRWGARERLLRLVPQAQADDPAVKQLKQKLYKVDDDDQIQTSAYSLDDEVDNYLLQRHQSGAVIARTLLAKVSQEGIQSIKGGLSKISSYIPGVAQDSGKEDKKPAGAEQDYPVLARGGSADISSLQAPGGEKTDQAGSKASGKTSGIRNILRTRSKTVSQGSDSSHAPGSTAQSSSIGEQGQASAAGDEQKKASAVHSPRAAPAQTDSATEFLSDVVRKPQGKPVQIDDDFERLKSFLGTEQYIWIGGKDGIGKSTLARLMFDDPSILTEFSGRAWVPVGQKFQARGIMASILLQLSYSSIGKEDIQAMATSELMEQLKKAMQDRKCLVVLDDVRSLESWETIRSTLPLDNLTKMIITTCLNEQQLDQNVLVRGETFLCRHGLDKDGSWELFQKHLSDKDIAVAEEKKQNLDDIKNEIFSLCARLPLAIRVLGSIVRGKLDKDSEMLNRLAAMQEDERFEEILSLSYKQLPFLLKSCFLYLGLFAEYQAIPVDKLFSMWIAEGVIGTGEHENKTRMETAADYLRALAQSGLVMLHELDSEGIKSCELHPLVRKLCISEGKKDGFIRMDGQTEESKGNQERPPTKRRISMQADSLQILMKTDEAKHIRALLLFMTKEYDGEVIIDLKDFKSARLLEFDGMDFSPSKFPKGIDKLVHLRHLSFRGCNLEHFSCSFKNLSLLETLDLLVKNSGTVTIPHDICEMSSLLHLYLPLCYKTDTPREKLKLERLINLETLENFHAGVCDVGDLKLLKGVRNFKGIAEGDHTGAEAMVNFIKEIQKIQETPFLSKRNPSLSLRKFDIESVDRNRVVTDLLTGPDLYLALEIEGFLSRLPAQNGKFEYICITELVFNGSEFSNDPMPALGCFKLLKNLILCNDAFTGSEMECKKGSFPKLQSLKLSHLWSLETLSVHSGAMPCLSSLIVEQCRSFKMSLSDLKKIPTLREVKVPGIDLKAVPS